MGLLSDLRVLYHLNLKPIRGDTHAQRLESFYASQADDYDVYRHKLLAGRQQLWNQIPVPRGGVWIDMGGGTGSNLEHLGPRIDELERVYVVDLCPSLLDIARRRISEHGWTHIELVEADAHEFQLPHGQRADVVTFSYSLTMISDWFAAIEHARAMLRPGGRLGVVDFYHSRKFAAHNMAQHSWLTRTFWRCLLERDNVILSADHLPFLQRHFSAHTVTEELTKVPYLPLLKLPYYVFVGQK